MDDGLSCWLQEKCEMGKHWHWDIYLDKRLPVSDYYFDKSLGKDKEVPVWKYLFRSSADSLYWKIMVSWARNFNRFEGPYFSAESTLLFRNYLLIVIPQYITNKPIIFYCCGSCWLPWKNQSFWLSVKYFHFCWANKRRWIYVVLILIITEFLQTFIKEFHSIKIN